MERKRRENRTETQTWTGVCQYHWRVDLRSMSWWSVPEMDGLKRWRRIHPSPVQVDKGRWIKNTWNVENMWYGCLLVTWLRSTPNNSNTPPCEQSGKPWKEKKKEREKKEGKITWCQNWTVDVETPLDQEAWWDSLPAYPRMIHASHSHFHLEHIPAQSDTKCVCVSYENDARDS